MLTFIIIASVLAYAIIGGITTRIAEIAEWQSEFKDDDKIFYSIAWPLVWVIFILVACYNVGYGMINYVINIIFRR